MKSLTFALVVIVTALFSAAGARAADTVCTGTVNSTTVTGNIVVPQNAACILNTVTVTGNVRILQNASLSVQADVEPSSIGGNIQADHCAFALLQGTVTVGGNIQIQNCTGQSGFIGPGVKIRGNFMCQNNAGPCEAWLGQVDGNAQIQNNSSAGASTSVSIRSAEIFNANRTRRPRRIILDPTGSPATSKDNARQTQGFAAVGTSIVPPGTPAGTPVACEDWQISRIFRFRTRKSPRQS